MWNFAVPAYIHRFILSHKSTIAKFQKNESSCYHLHDILRIILLWWENILTEMRLRVSNNLSTQGDRDCAPSGTSRALSEVTPPVTPRAWCEAGPRAPAAGTRTRRPTTAHAPRRGGASAATWAGQTPANTRVRSLGTRAARVTRSTTACAQVKLKRNNGNLFSVKKFCSHCSQENLKSLVFSGLMRLVRRVK